MAGSDQSLGEREEEVERLRQAVKEGERKVRSLTGEVDEARGGREEVEEREREARGRERRLKGEVTRLEGSLAQLEEEAGRIEVIGQIVGSLVVCSVMQ